MSNTVKPVLNGHSNIDKTKVLMTNVSLMKVKSIAECSSGNCIKQFCPKNQFLVFFFEWPLKTGFTVCFNLILIECYASAGLGLIWFAVTICGS